MTESDKSDIEYCLRQGLLSGKKVPVLWGGPFELLQHLHETCDADVGFFGTGMDGILPVASKDQATEIPYAARYLACSKESTDLCTNEDRFCATCWMDRDDVDKTAFRAIRATPNFQVRWHPGWRSHRLRGRVLALSILDALQVAVSMWSEGTMGACAVVGVVVVVVVVERGCFCCCCTHAVCYV
jgi:hypothetical protein